jgi:hypothetical protein
MFGVGPGFEIDFKTKFKHKKLVKFKKFGNPIARLTRSDDHLT